MKKAIIASTLAIAVVSVTTVIFAQQKSNQRPAVDTPPPIQEDNTQNSDQIQNRFAKPATSQLDSPPPQDSNTVPPLVNRPIRNNNSFSNTRPPTSNQQSIIPGQNMPANFSAHPASVSSFRRPTALQSKYASLAARVAKTMSDDELKAEIAKFEKRIEEEIAQMNMQSVHTQLKSIIQRYPKSKAAKKAQMMLDSISETESESAAAIE